MDRTGRAIVLIQRPYDNRGKKVNVVNRYDVFGRHSYTSFPQQLEYQFAMHRVNIAVRSVTSFPLSVLEPVRIPRHWR